MGLSGQKQREGAMTTRPYPLCVVRVPDPTWRPEAWRSALLVVRLMAATSVCGLQPSVQNRNMHSLRSREVLDRDPSVLAILVHP